MIHDSRFTIRSSRFSIRRERGGRDGGREEGRERDRERGFIYIYRERERETDRQTDRQTDRETEREALRREEVRKLWGREGAQAHGWREGEGAREGKGREGRVGEGRELSFQCSWFTVYDSQVTDHGSRFTLRYHEIRWHNYNLLNKSYGTSWATTRYSYGTMEPEEAPSDTLMTLGYQWGNREILLIFKVPEEPPRDARYWH